MSPHDILKFLIFFNEYLYGYYEYSSISIFAQTLIMKKLALSFATAILLFSLSGCQKLLEYAESHGYPVPVKSLIQKLDYRNDVFPNQTENSFTFLYNSAHDPIYALRANVSTGTPQFVFRYNASGLLTDLIAAYDTAIAEGHIESWHKYFYNAGGDIVTDSAIWGPTVADGQPTKGAHGLGYAATYEYDAQHRMIRYKVFSDQTPGVVIDSVYSYDTHGNKTGIGHDNKVNFNRTSRVLQFLDQDYSVNNPSAAYTYNKDGLPTSITASIPVSIFIVPAEDVTHINSATLTYTRY